MNSKMRGDHVLRADVLQIEIARIGGIVLRKRERRVITFDRELSAGEFDKSLCVNF